MDDALDINPLVGPVEIGPGGSETGALPFPEKVKRSQIGSGRGNIFFCILPGQYFVAIVERVKCRHITGNRMPVGTKSVKRYAGRIF